MICSHCQKEIADASSFCSFCGARQRSNRSGRRLVRSSADSKIAGVCGGIAEYADVDPTLVRVLWIALAVVPGAVAGGILAYVLCWIVIPKAPAQLPETTSAALQQPAK
jgi:phage shock protein C